MRAEMERRPCAVPSPSLPPSLSLGWHWRTRLPDCLGGAAGGEQLNALLVEEFGELDEASLVRDGKKRTLHVHQVSDGAFHRRESGRAHRARVRRRGKPKARSFRSGGTIGESTRISPSQTVTPLSPGRARGGGGCAGCLRARERCVTSKASSRNLTKTTPSHSKESLPLFSSHKIGGSAQRGDFVN